VPFEIAETQTNSFQHRPAQFTERDNLLQKIAEKCNASTQSCTVLYLHGMTGCGKSLISRHYARTRNFSARFELPGQSKLDFEASLGKCAEHVPGLCEPSPPKLGDMARATSAGRESEDIRNQEDNNITAFLGWLNAKGNDQWFILIDDLQWTDSDQGKVHWVQQYISKLHQGTILITSQSSSLTQVYSHLKVEGMSVDESLSLMDEVLGAGNDDLIRAGV
jgi:hypothetical protein